MGLIQVNGLLWVLFAAAAILALIQTLRCSAYKSDFYGSVNNNRLVVKQLVESMKEVSRKEATIRQLRQNLGEDGKELILLPSEEELAQAKADAAELAFYRSDRVHARVLLDKLVWQIRDLRAENEQLKAGKQ